MEIGHKYATAILIPVFFALLYTQFTYAVLYENGTCTNEKITKGSNQTINTNGTIDDFLESLPSDNTILAQIVCQPDSK